MESQIQANYIDERVKQAVASSQTALLSKLDSLISSKFTCFETKISDVQKDLSESQLAKIQQNILANDSYTFKRKSCEDQFKFNAKVATKLREAETSVTNLKDVPQAINSISEGINLINHRQKLIRMADVSESGWKVVHEYETNPLASDSDDEKKINRAESRASKKLKIEQAKRIKKSTRFSSWPASQPAGKSGANTQQTSVSSVTSAKKPGLCFNCGQPGHWKYSCPQRRQLPSDKISDNICSIIDLSFDWNQKTDYEPSVLIKETKGVPNKSFVLTTVGRLKASLKHWEEAKVNEHIKAVIVDGYRIPFRTLPGVFHLKNNRSALENKLFVATEIEKLKEKGCISEVLHKPSCVNPLTVAFSKNGKPRLVLDCRDINPHLAQFKFKYEDVTVAKQMFVTGDYLFTFDLKSAYHHIEIFVQHRPYLGFSWDKEGVTHYYQFNVLPFGLATAPYIFTKMMKVFLTLWRSRGHKIIMFIDDGLAGSSTLEAGLILSNKVQKSLQDLGFLISHEKCVWEPSQSAQWLGFSWLMASGSLHAVPNRIDRVEKMLESIIYQMDSDKCHLIPARILASAVGQIISLTHSIGRLVRLQTRALYRCIDTRASWNAPVKIDHEAYEEIRFWKKEVRTLNDKGLSIESKVDHVIEAYSDASAIGYGGYVSLGAGALLEGTEVMGSWNKEEAQQSSSWREAVAVERVLKSTLKCWKTGKLNGLPIIKM